MVFSAKTYCSDFLRFSSFFYLVCTHPLCAGSGLKLSISLQFLALEPTTSCSYLLDSCWSHSCRSTFLSWCSDVISVCQVEPAPSMSTPWLGFLGRLWSALTSRYLLEPLDLLPKLNWNIMFLQGTYGKGLFFSEKFCFLQICHFGENSFFLLSHIILTFYQVTVFALFQNQFSFSGCYKGLVFTVIQSSIILLSFPSMMSCGYHLLYI